MTTYLCCIMSHPSRDYFKKYDVSQWIRCKGWQQSQRGRKNSCILVIPHENQKKVVIVFRLFRKRGVFHYLYCCFNTLLHIVMFFFFVLRQQHFNRL